MAVRHGYGKVVTDGLVFAYDTGDTINSYKGEPVNNLHAVDPGNVHTSFNAVGTTAEEVDFITPFGNKAWKITIPSSGTNGFSNTRANGNTTTIQRDGTNYFHGCYVWVADDQYSTWSTTAVYKYTTGTNGWTSWSYKPDFDRKDTTGRIWKLWGAVTSNTEGGTGNEYHTFFKNGTLSQDLTFYVVAPMMLEGKDHPVQFTAGTRSVSGSLLDLTGTGTLDLTNVSFDDNAQPTFNGSNNRIYIGQDLGLQNTSFSVEALVYWDGDSTDTFFGYYDTVTSGTQRSIHWRIYSSGQVRFDFYANSINSATGAIVANTWYHLLVTYDSTSDSCKCYRNGELLMQGSAGPYLGNDSDSKGYVGAWTPSSQPFGGEVPIFKLYNRALTEGEVRQNFAHYKNRFNI